MAKKTRIGIGILLVLCIGIGGYLAYHYKPFRSPFEEKSVVSGVVPSREQKKVVHLYFSDRTGEFLTAESRTIRQSNDPVQFAKAILEALLKGPEGPYGRTIPKGTKVRSFQITSGGTAYIDLTREVREGQPGGAEAEFLTIFSLVNTLCLNHPRIEAVKILVEGREMDTLSGHIDVRFPFRPNLTMIR